MTEQEKLERVIEGLEKIAEFFKTLGDMVVGDGKMLLLSCMRAAEDAIALLKAQEPRVMTLEEAERADYCWLESQEVDDVTILEPVLRNGGWAEGIGFTNGINCDYDCVLNEYNIVWRCWTSRPTDEQMEATQWNAQK